MRLALVTKLKLGVKFGINYKAVSLTVHAIDGYAFIYRLISYLHPRLMRNRAVNHKTIKLSKPNFDGNIHDFTQNYYS